jgi:uncharacterized protein (TIGR00269 family)
VLPAASGFARKVKPLFRLGERELAAYCVLQGIDYIVEECPMAAGNRHLGYKEALNDIEERSPGSKAAFVFGFLDRAQPRFANDAAEEREDLRPCASCGAPTPLPRPRKSTNAVREGTAERSAFAGDPSGRDAGIARSTEDDKELLCAFCRMQGRATR